MRGPFQAAALAALFGVLSWVLPLPHLSAGVVGLVAMARGPLPAFKVLGLALVPVAAVALGLFGSAAPVVVLALWWLSALVFGALLARCADQGVVLVAIAALALLGAAALRLVTGDVTAFWAGVVERFMTLLAEAGGELPLADPETLRQSAAVLTSVLAAGVVMNVMLTLLLARWWQAMLYNPGGFRQEFRRMGLPRGGTGAVALLAGLSVGAALLTPAAAGVAADVSAVAMVVLAFIGLAVAHHEVARRGWPVGALVLMYLALVLLQGVALLALVLLAVVDGARDLRGLRGRKAGD